MRHRSRISRNGIAWLELLLALAFVLLVLQLVPSLRNIVLRTLDFRNWPRTVWFVGNAVVVALLLSVRFGPDLLQQWRERRQRIASERAKVKKALAVKKEREDIERMQESRRRRIY